ncbi:MAG TPA: ABC transporter ATP-binding protein [Clostridia bacterium]|nr:ABC transporter ATP-binding protein [Clostridia bacterium]
MLVIKDLVKRYGKFTAVDQVNLKIESGSIFGFVGPNGAGKTTTIKIIATLMQPTSGTVEVEGMDVVREPLKVRERIGYMPDFFGVYDNLKVHEYMDFYGSSYGMPYKERQKAAGELLELVDLGHKKDSYVDTLSRGMKQRLCLARSLIHNPELLVLDEPASGLDPRARIEIKGILKELKGMNKTILISSHILSELAEMCDTIGIIENGKMVIDGSVEDIMRRISGRTIIRLKFMDRLEEAINLLKEQPLVEEIIQEGNSLEVTYSGEDQDLWKLLRILVNQELPILSFGKADGNLEQIFMEVTKGEEMAL